MSDGSSRRSCRTRRCSARVSAPALVDDPLRGRRLAVAACNEWDLFRVAVEQDLSATQVRERLRRLSSLAHQAYRHDVRWLRLVSAAMSLSQALEVDDAGAADLGMRMAEEQCLDARAAP